MIVAELVKLLLAMPQGAPVVIEADGSVVVRKHKDCPNVVTVEKKQTEEEFYESLTADTPGRD